MAEEMTATSTNTSQDAQNASQDTKTPSTTVDSTKVEKDSQTTPDKSKDTSIEDLIQRAVDRATQKLGTENKKLKEELKEKLTAEELRALELKDKEADLADREAKLQEKINREFAMKAIKDAGLDDGGSNSLKLIDFVVCNDEKDTLERVKVFGELVDKFVKAEVDKTFKQNGRNPNGSNTDSKPSTNVAEQLGKVRADTAKKTNDVLSHYLGGK